MKTIKVLTSAERADWLTRDPDEYFAFVRAEAKIAARREVRMGQKIVGQKDPLTWTLAPLVGALLVLLALAGLIALVAWPR